MTTDCVNTKSSAVSVWIFAGVDGRERVATFPSGSPVEKVNEAAEAWRPDRSKASVPAVILLADRVARTDGLTPRRAGVSTFEFISFRSFVITFFLVFCFRDSDWNEGLDADAVTVTQAIRRFHRSKRIRVAFAWV